MIRTHVRAKGGAPQLGARRPYETGPFGVRPREDDDHRASVRTTDGSATPTEGAANTTEENQ